MKRLFLKIILPFASKNKYVLKLVHKLSADAYMDVLGVKHGMGCRIYCQGFGSEPYLVSMGDHVSCGTNVQFITHDGGVWVLRETAGNPNLDYFAPIKIGNNVFIGNDAMILPGVSIGDNVIIGAKSLVTKNIPSNTVWGGVPARRLKTLEEYCSKVDKCVETKLMPDSAKRKFLLAKFSDGDTL